MKNVLSVCSLILLFAGCDAGLLSDMDRVSRYPAITAPLVESFQTELSIGVAWDVDDAADEFLLKRARDEGAALTYTVVYEGNDISYIDTDVEDEGLYLYTLTKKRGNEEFGPSSAILGVGNECIDDLAEPNDTKENATPITYQYVANTYYYQESETFTSLEDCDWYSITIPAAHRANLTVTQNSPAVAVGSDSYLLFLLEGAGASTTIKNANSFSIDNTGLNAATCRFRITPIAAECIDTPLSGGGTVIEYSVKIVSTESLF